MKIVMALILPLLIIGFMFFMCWLATEFDIFLVTKGYRDGLGGIIVLSFTFYCLMLITLIKL